MAAFSKKGRPRGSRRLQDVSTEDLAALQCMTNADAARSIGVPLPTYERELKRRGIKKQFKAKSEARIKFLEKFAAVHDKYPDSILSEMFGLSVSGLQKVRASLGLKKDIKVMWKINKHPRGAKGLVHSDEARRKVSEAVALRWRDMTPDAIEERNRKMMATRQANGTVAPSRPGATWKAGWREIGGKRHYFRSKWEANYARYMQWLKERGEIAEWEHEAEVFWFDGIKRGCVSYLPDFRVTLSGGSVEYHEVKGWMDDRSKTKISRMAKYHPKVKLIVIDAKSYQSIKRSVAPLISGWE